jgi:hypothetical protein
VNPCPFLICRVSGRQRKHQFGRAANKFHRNRPGLSSRFHSAGSLL